MNWVTIVGGAVLFFSPFVTGYSDNPAALRTSLMMGVALVVLGYLKNYKWAAVTGLVTLVAPWLLGFSTIGAALWNCTITGGVIMIADGYYGFFLEKGKHNSQHA